MTKNDEGRLFPFGVLPELAALLRAQWEKSTSLALEPDKLSHRVPLE